MGFVYIIIFFLFLYKKERILLYRLNPTHSDKIIQYYISAGAGWRCRQEFVGLIWNSWKVNGFPRTLNEHKPSEKRSVEFRLMLEDFDLKGRRIPALQVKSQV